MTTLARAETAEQRARIFVALEHRNRLVRVLRIGVPAIGALVLAGLLLQIYVGSLTEDFGFANIRIDRDNLVVDRPSYAGVWADGSHFNVAADTAKAAFGRSDVIEVQGASVTMDRPGGSKLGAKAVSAQIRTSEQTVTADGVVEISQSGGANGTITDAVFDVGRQTLLSNGPVHMTFANGATIDAGDLSYDAKSGHWIFSRVTLTLNSTPGEKAARAVQAAAPEERP